MAEIDFITALGRLLRDGPLRDAFAVNPAGVAAQLAVRAGDRPALAGLSPAELEIQAAVLLRKRFELLRRLVPATLARLKEQAWPLFQQYGRAHWPDGANAPMSDAWGFCNYCRQTRVEVLCPSELNRLRFALGSNRIALHCIRGGFALQRAKFGLQIFFRTGSGRVNEWSIYLAI